MSDAAGPKDRQHHRGRPFRGKRLKTTLPKQMWDDILLQVNPTLAAASVVVLVIVTLLFILAEYLRPASAARP